ncbi:UNVERIFIED_CONTAM: rhoptry neck protein RON6 [Hammondia hammondi]|eukprot:XP_008886064.1 rhoptry neck protein RON6 [Hammondia hammondi]
MRLTQVQQMLTTVERSRRKASTNVHRLKGDMRLTQVQQMLTTVERNRRKASTNVHLLKGDMRLTQVQQMLTTVERNRRKASTNVHRLKGDMRLTQHERAPAEGGHEADAGSADAHHGGEEQKEGEHERAPAEGGHEADAGSADAHHGGEEQKEGEHERAHGEGGHEAEGGSADAHHGGEEQKEGDSESARVEEEREAGGAPVHAHLGDEGGNEEVGLSLGGQKQDIGGESASSEAGHATTRERKSGYSHEGRDTGEDTVFSHAGGETRDERETRRSHREQGKERTEKGGARDQPQNEKKTEEQHAKKQEEQYKLDIAVSKHQEAEENRRHADVLLQHHHLGQGGPRGRTAVTSHSHMHVQDVTQHHQLQEATQMAGKLTRHLQIQNTLKLREMFLKRKEVGHLNLLKHLQDLMQAVVSRIYSKLKRVKRSLKRMYSHSRWVIKRFLHETDHKVVRPEELPSAVLTPTDEGDVLGKTTNGIVMDCPTDCNPAACDNKPVEPAQCFKYEAVAGGGGFRRCEPFADPLTATCGKGFTRCAMAAPARGKHYQMFASPPDHPLPQPLLIQGSNLHACLRLLPVHQATRCSPESAETVEAALKDTQAVAQQPPPHVLEQAVLFENIQVPMPGSYKLCMLQYWRPPDSKPTDNVFIMGIDEIGTLDVLQQPDAETLKHVQGLHKKDSQMH